MATQEPNPDLQQMDRLARDTELDAREMGPNRPSGTPEGAAKEFATNQAELNQIMVKTFTAINGRLEAMAADVEQVKSQQETTAGDMDERFDKIDLHLGYLRGAHAANVVQRNAGLIADDMGYQVITQLPREELIGFANMARAAGKPESDVRSFREADLVMLVRNSSGHPAYIAVEASFTVGSNDIKRAKRNAEYLHEFTGLPAKGAVAGVDIGSGREQNANTDGVYCYRIPVRDLEAD